MLDQAPPACRNRRSRRRPARCPHRPATPKIDVAGMNFYYGAAPRAREHRARRPAEPGDGAHRAVGLRQVHLPALAQPDERHRARRARRGLGPHRRRRTSTPPSVDVVDLRRRVGMVFQKSNPFPKSIFDNVAYGLRINRLTRSREELRRPRRGEPEGRRRSGTKSRIGCTPRRWRSPAASSSGSASRARWPSSRRSC